MVTVIIATANRPAMLRQALASVQAQTEVARVGEVLVSENAGCVESELVCKEFPKLPIRYVRRDPPLSREAHGRTLLCEEPGPGPYAAILNDDDWWAPEHLDRGLAWLDGNPRASAWTCCAFSVVGSSPELDCDNNFLQWFAAGYPPKGETWELDLTAVMLANLGETSLRYSALVARTALLVPAAKAMAKVYNPFDNDRLLAFEIARQGPIGYAPLPSAFIRMHPGQDVNNFDHKAMSRYRRGATAYLVGECVRLGIDLRAVIALRYEQCPAESRERLISQFCTPRWAEALTRHGLAPASLARRIVPPPTASMFQEALRLFVPPIVLGGSSTPRRQS